jgi:drug/metabolite transporter (DMT)-like permease
VPVRPALALAATVVLWGSAFAAIRAALEHFSAAHLSVLRLLVASLVLCAIAAARGVRLPARRDLPAIAAVALAGMTAYQLLLNSGERTVPAGTASLLVNLSPVFTAIGASAWLGEDMTRRRWAGVAVACSGATLIAVAGDGGLSLEKGALLVLGAAAVQAAFFLLQKPLLRRYGSLELTTWAMALGALMTLPFAPGLPGAIQ